MNFHETQRTSKLNIDSLKVNVNDIAIVFYEKTLLENYHNNTSITLLRF